jgi:DNA repair protein RadC
MNIDNLIPSQQQDAANLFRTYGSLAGVMTTPELELAANPDIGNRCAANIAAARKLIVQGAYAPLANVPVITSYDTLFQYLQWSTDRDGIERLRLLCMGPPGNLISDMEIVIGTHNNVHVEPSEIVTRALAVRATSIIIVHNHPSGVAQPSKNDIDCTCELKAACDLVRIRLDDHVIVAAGTMYSFRQNKRL